MCGQLMIVIVPIMWNSGSKLVCVLTFPTTDSHDIGLNLYHFVQSIGSQHWAQRLTKQLKRKKEWCRRVVARASLSEIQQSPILAPRASITHSPRSSCQPSQSVWGAACASTAWYLNQLPSTQSKGTISWYRTFLPSSLPKWMKTCIQLS